MKIGRKGLIFLGILLGFTVMAGASMLSPSAPPTSGTVPVNANNGPQVDVVDASNITMDGTTWPDDNTVVVQTSQGNATFQASGPANVTVTATNITGTTTNLTELDVATNELYIDPADKPGVNISGDVEHFVWWQTMTVNDGKTDFYYQGASGTTTATVRGVPEDTELAAVDQSNTLLDVATSDTSMTNSEHSVTVQTNDGGPSLSNPTPEGDLQMKPSQLCIDVSDPDLPDDNVSVTFKLDGSQVGTATTKANGQVCTSISSLSRGEHTASATATDSFGATATQSWSFGVPETLYVRNVTAPNALINDRPVNFTLYEEGDVFTAQTTDGTLNLTNFPINGDIVGRVEAENFTTRTFVIEDITNQQNVYLLHRSVPQVEVRFTLTDRTGNFAGNNATLFIQRPISDTGDLQWKTVIADEFGVNGVTTQLEQDQRYRLIIKNADKDMRVLGTYTADVSETINLEVGSISGKPDTPDGLYTYNFSYQNVSNSSYVKFGFNDTANETDRLYVEIYEYGNESNVLLKNTSFGGPFGTFALSEGVPSGQKDVTWRVKVTVVRGSETFQLASVVGPQSPVFGDFPGWLMVVISMGTIFAVGGLFSQLNGDIGALVTAGIGAMFWYLDFMPDSIGSGVVALALIMAGVIFLNERRGGAGI